MDAVAEELQVFKASIARTRWFLITTVLISTLIVLHTYLDQFGLQKQQLESLLAHRSARGSLIEQECYRAIAKSYEENNERPLIAYLPECGHPRIKDRVPVLENKSRDELLQEFSVREITIRMTDSSIKAAQLGSRAMPIIGVQIPENDFVTLMAVMSLIFVAGVWISLRGVHAALEAMSQRPGAQPLLQVAKLNTVFLTSVLPTGQSTAIMLRFLATWLPFASIFGATLVNAYDIWTSIDVYHFGKSSTIYAHLGIAFAVSAVHFCIAWKTRIVLATINSILNMPPAANQLAPKAPRKGTKTKLTTPSPA